MFNCEISSAVTHQGASCKADETCRLSSTLPRRTSGEPLQERMPFCRSVASEWTPTSTCVPRAAALRSKSCCPVLRSANAQLSSTAVAGRRRKWQGGARG
eukprot:TRINITY_DN5489_c0_g2_i1.p2 TRINITY_DN5489_c0_g2~~TRINITY_DN5489_c0_g2_i1.p2  ORF type:complete len:100 (+),score=5.46 TRINITY_DN5489_c0_g2_i1:302-601(+)